MPPRKLTSLAPPNSARIAKKSARDAVSPLVAAMPRSTVSARYSCSSGLNRDRDHAESVSVSYRPASGIRT
jgi:hypothetical protein